MLASKVKRQPEGLTAKQCAFLLKRTDSPVYKNNRKSGCFLSMMNEKKRTKPPKRGQTDTGVEPYYFFNYSSKC